MFKQLINIIVELNSNKNFKLNFIHRNLLNKIIFK